MTAIERSDGHPRRSEVANKQLVLFAKQQTGHAPPRAPQTCCARLYSHNLFYSHCCLAITAFVSIGNTLSRVDSR